MWSYCTTIQCLENFAGTFFWHILAKSIDACWPVLISEALGGPCFPLMIIWNKLRANELLLVPPLDRLVITLNYTFGSRLLGVTRRGWTSLDELKQLSFMVLWVTARPRRQVALQQGGQPDKDDILTPPPPWTVPARPISGMGLCGLLGNHWPGHHNNSYEENIMFGLKIGKTVKSTEEKKNRGEGWKVCISLNQTDNMARRLCGFDPQRLLGLSRESILIRPWVEWQSKQRSKG